MDNPSEPGLLLRRLSLWGVGEVGKSEENDRCCWDGGLGVLEIPCTLALPSLVAAAAAVWVSRDWENRLNRQLLCWLQQPAALDSYLLCCCSRPRRKQSKQRAGFPYLS